MEIKGVSKPEDIILESRKIAHFKIDLNFKINHYQDLSNIFSTDAVNSGIRAELSGEHLGVVSSTKDGRLLGVVSTVRLVEGANYHLVVEFKDHKLSLCVDGNCETSPKYTELSPALGTMTLGYGFNSDRVFFGEISNIRINATVLENNVTDLDFSVYVASLLVMAVLYLFVRSPISLEMSHLKLNQFGRADFDYLMLLRIFAWFCVFSIHSYIVFKIQPSFKEMEDFAFLLHFSAWSGVWVFFALTGYLMGKMFLSGRYGISSQGFKNFIRNRFLQIIPIYWFSIFIICIFVNPEIFRPENIKILYKMMFFMYDAEESININGALWSLTTEMYFYLLAPFVIYLFVLMVYKNNSVEIKRLNSITFLVVVLGLATRYYLNLKSGFTFNDWPSVIYKPLYANIDLFLLGVLANFYVIHFQNRFVGANFKFLLFLFVLSLYLISSFISYSAFQKNDLVPLFIIALPTITAIIAFLYVIFSEPNMAKEAKPSSEKRFNFIIYLGVLTYPIYVWHEPILRSVQNSFYDYGYFLKVGIAIVLVFIMSHLTYLLVESYFIKKKSFE
jgi:peptidoglycan/LPS O-acetylase OafA/YrhL